jgi:hypothetical protein
MKKFSSLLILFAALHAKCQETTDSAKVNSGSGFKIGIFYNSYLHYYGRVDSLESAGVFPVAEYWFDKHFYISAAPVFTTGNGRSMEYAGTVAMAGYRFGKENRSSWNFFLVKPIYKDNSQLVQSALKAQLGASGTWLNKILNLTAGGDIKLSDQLDLGAQAGIDHIFRFQLKGPSVLVIDPTFQVNAGTQQFSKTYFKESSFLFFPGMQQEITEKINRFDILSYEMSVPIIFAKGRIQFIVSPSYVIPKNLIGERGANKFYGLAGAKITI